jgi:hypothetical protein
MQYAVCYNEDDAVWPDLLGCSVDMGTMIALVC